MSDKPKGLGELIDSLQRGVQSMTKGKQERPEPTIDESAPIDNAHLDATEPGSDPHRDEDTDHDDLLDPVQEDKKSEPQTLGARLAALSMKQKALLAAVLVVAAFAIKSNMEAPIAPESPAEQTTDVGDASLGEEATSAADTFSPTSGSFDDSTGLSSDEDTSDLTLSLEEKTGDFSSAAIATEEEIAPLKAAAQQLPAEPAPAFQPTDEAIPFQQAPVPGEAPADSVTQTPVAPGQAVQPDAAVSDSPFGQDPQPSFGEGTLAGTNFPVVDSGQAVAATPEEMTQSAEISGKVEELESLIRKQNESIKSLEAALAIAQKKPEPAVTASAQTATKEKVAQAKPAVQRARSAPATVRRPNFCVKAVAQVARNCSTCVAHAFVVHNRVETMVGHGDEIEKFRVSITGDRIELQGAPGTEPFKFWPMPGGCAS